MVLLHRSRGWKALFASVPVLVAIALPLAAFGARSGDAQQKRDVETLANDAMQGRDDGTAGSALAQNYLISQLKLFARGANSAASGDDAFRQTIPGGTNIVAIIPGTDLANEYVIVGAHYDHLGSFCSTTDSADRICNGATDNAAGVANVLTIGRAIASQRRAPRRSIILAFWDQEEDGLVGSTYYVQNPLVPLADTVAYVNYDIQGANLLPKLRRSTFAIASETGGASFARQVRRAATGVGLRTRFVSSIFGQYRSDYANFINAQVPTVFFSDSTGPCYHTAQDDTDVVDFTKLSSQASIGTRLVKRLATGPRSTFDAGAPFASYDDVVMIRNVVRDALPDIGRFDPADQATLRQFLADLNSVVKAGRANFDNADVALLAVGTLNAVTILTTGQCDGFLAPPYDTPICGDGNREIAGEECDDGNVIDGDGCDSNCKATGCGNGVRTGSEQCDDGNLASGDGCSAGCLAEFCGDGLVQPTLGEDCEDGNVVDGDGCDSNCKTTGCGNGVQTGSEQCDDGNLVSGDGCSAGCLAEFCGDGIVLPTLGEDCDDGNIIDGDGCDSNCRATGCGNGIQTAAEECDDGNLAGGDGCSAGCVLEFCGNGIVDVDGERCDLPDDTACPSSCFAALCLCGPVPTSPVTEDLTPCTPAVIDTWKFAVAAGDTVAVRADTVDAATAADLCFNGDCPGTVYFGDDDESCTFTPPRYACPSTSFIAPAAGTCTVRLGLCSGTCASAATASYQLRVTLDGLDTAVGLASDD